MDFVKKTLSVALIMAAFSIGSVCYAFPDDPTVMKPVEKLSRGIINVAFGPFEIVMKTFDTTKNYGSLPGLVYGPLKGICYFVAREGVGVIDIVTFPFPLPGCPDDPNDYGYGYGPIMRPAWVVDIDHNYGNFFYNDTVTVDSEQ